LLRAGLHMAIDFFMCPINRFTDTVEILCETSQEIFSANSEFQPH
jgi:hypothetical protein